MTARYPIRLSAAALGLLVLCSARTASSYSVLTHEATIIDSTWDTGVKPLLLERFPASTPDELTEAHAYAYGGSITQDLGYYPFGSKLSTDLTHYMSRYASDTYKAFIGFQVSKPVLQRAFEDTYGVRIEQVFFNVDLAIGSYRRAVGTVLPALTKVAWQIKGQEIIRDPPGITRGQFLYNLSRSSYEKNWGATYRLRVDILAFYQDRSLPIATKANAGDWSRLLREIDRLTAVDQDLAAAGASRPAALSAAAAR